MSDPVRVSPSVALGANRDRPGWRRILPYGLLLLLLLWLGVGCYRALGSAIHARALAADLAALWNGRGERGEIPGELLGQAQLQAGYLTQDLSGLQRWVSPLACGLLARMPPRAIADYGQYACDGLLVGAGLAETLRDVLAAAHAAAVDGRVEQADAIEAALARLAEGRARLEMLLPAAERLQQQAADGRVTEQARQPARLSSFAVNALIVAPSALGGDASRTYLVLLQNSDELRATGGFIGSVVVVALQGHRITSMQYLNSYDVEPRGAQMPPAPAPLVEYMAAPGLVFRDANWSPDFPSSAAVLAALYSAHRGQVDGIVAIDTEFLRQVLYAVGPVPVAKYGIALNGDNLVHMAETYWENPLEGAALSGIAEERWDWSRHRKDFGGDFADAARSHVASIDAGAWLRFAGTAARMAEERHLLIWAASESVQAAIARAGWSGEVRRDAGDYLMVVDSNVGFNKVDRRIERAFHYELDLVEDTPRVSVTLSYTHTGTAEVQGCVHEARVLESYDALTQQCYWNYTRILVRTEAELVRVNGNTQRVDEGAEAGSKSLGTLVLVAPGQRVDLVFTYSLPSDLISCQGRTCELRLTVQKQPGTDATPLQIATGAGLPGAQVLGVGLSEVDGVATTDLSEDRRLVLRWRRGVTGE